MKYANEISALVTLIKDFDNEMLSDDEWNKLALVDCSIQTELLQAFNQYIVVEYNNLTLRAQKSIKSSLYLALTQPKFDLNKVLERVYMPFGPIKDPIFFFKTLWLALFNENFTVVEK